MEQKASYEELERKIVLLEQQMEEYVRKRNNLATDNIFLHDIVESLPHLFYADSVPPYCDQGLIHQQFGNVQNRKIGGDI